MSLYQVTVNKRRRHDPDSLHEKLGLELCRSIPPFQGIPSPGSGCSLASSWRIQSRARLKEPESVRPCSGASWFKIQPPPHQKEKNKKRKNPRVTSFKDLFPFLKDIQVWNENPRQSRKPSLRNNTSVSTPKSSNPPPQPQTSTNTMQIIFVVLIGAFAAIGSVAAVLLEDTIMREETITGAAADEDCIVS